MHLASRHLDKENRPLAISVAARRIKREPPTSTLLSFCRAGALATSHANIRV
jgi:hypothetical protein